ncbi:hypothetical protein DIPPA_02166 [Diplonema papillatum]|nr:hypothetical protein DIPPA_02166 [Diplonema papillatum]
MAGLRRLESLKEQGGGVATAGGTYGGYPKKLPKMHSSPRSGAGGGGDAGELADLDAFLMQEYTRVTTGSLRSPALSRKALSPHGLSGYSKVGTAPPTGPDRRLSSIGSIGATGIPARAVRPSSATSLQGSPKAAPAPGLAFHVLEGERGMRGLVEAAEATYRERIASRRCAAVVAETASRWADLILAEAFARAQVVKVMSEDWAALVDCEREADAVIAADGLFQALDDDNPGGGSGARTPRTPRQRSASQSGRQASFVKAAHRRSSPAGGGGHASRREQSLLLTVARLRARVDELEDQLEAVDVRENKRLTHDLQMAHVTILELRSEIRAHDVSKLPLDSFAAPPSPFGRKGTGDANSRASSSASLSSQGFDDDAPVPMATPRCIPALSKLLPRVASEEVDVDAGLRDQFLQEVAARNKKYFAKAASYDSLLKSFVPGLNLGSFARSPVVGGDRPDSELTEQLLQEQRSRANRQFAKSASMDQLSHLISCAALSQQQTDQQQQQQQQRQQRPISDVPLPPEVAARDKKYFAKAASYDSLLKSFVPGLNLGSFARSPIAGSNRPGSELTEQLQEQRSRANRQFAKSASMDQLSHLISCAALSQQQTDQQQQQQQRQQRPISDVPLPPVCSPPKRPTDAFANGDDTSSDDEDGYELHGMSTPRGERHNKVRAA